MNESQNQVPVIQENSEQDSEQRIQDLTVAIAELTDMNQELKQENIWLRRMISESQDPQYQLLWQSEKTQAEYENTILRRSLVQSTENCNESMIKSRELLEGLTESQKQNQQKLLKEVSEIKVSNEKLRQTVLSTMGDITQETTDLFYNHFKECMLPVEVRAEEMMDEMKQFQDQTFSACTKERDEFLNTTRRDFQWAKRDFITRILLIILVVTDITITLLNVFLWRK